MPGRIPRIAGGGGGASFSVAGRGGLWVPMDSYPSATISSIFTGTVNLVRFYQFTNPFTVTVRRMIFRLTVNGAAGTFCSIGVYDLDGNRLFHTGAVAADGALAVKDIVLGTPFVLQPGAYIVAWTTDGTAAAATGLNAISNVNEILNAGTDSRTGTAANAGSGGVVPATLGALTDVNSVGIILTFLAP